MAFGVGAGAGAGFLAVVLAFGVGALVGFGISSVGQYVLFTVVLSLTILTPVVFLTLVHDDSSSQEVKVTTVVKYFVVVLGFLFFGFLVGFGISSVGQYVV